MSSKIDNIPGDKDPRPYDFPAMIRQLSIQKYGSGQLRTIEQCFLNASGLISQSYELLALDIKNFEKKLNRFSDKLKRFSEEYNTTSANVNKVFKKHIFALIKQHREENEVKKEPPFGMYS